MCKYPDKELVKFAQNMLKEVESIDDSDLTAQQLNQLLEQLEYIIDRYMKK